MRPSDLGARLKTIAGVTVLAGTVWAVPVRWLHVSLAGASSRRASAEAEVQHAEASLVAIPTVEPAAAAATARRDAILNELSVRIPRGTRLYEVLGETARAHRLRIARIQPSHLGHPDARGAHDKGVNVGAAGYTIEATGDFQDVTAFVSEVESMAFSFVTGVRCSPVSSGDPTSQRVSAEIETVQVQISETEHDRDRAGAGEPRT